MARLSSHLGHIAAEVKDFVAARLSLAHMRAGWAGLIDATFPLHQVSHTDDAAPVQVLGAGLEPAAWSTIRFLDGEGCAMCARPFEGGLWLGEGALCTTCTETPFPFGRGRAACIYGDGSRGLILGFKHGDRLDLKPMLSRWIERAGADLWDETDIVMPVPLHRWRLLKRRYNQAAELARPVARRRGLTYLGDILKRVRQTNQAGKSAQARWDNVRGAFVVPPRGRARIAGKRIVLVDDVFTTGSTLRACARTLLDAGAKEVNVVVLARALPA